MEFDVIYINVSVEGTLHVTGLSIKVDHDLGGVGVSHEEYINTWRYTGWINARGSFSLVGIGAHI